jgi:hypothetical protein
MRNTLILKILVLFILLQSCKGSKTVSEDSDMKKETLKAIVNQYKSSRPDFETMRGRIKAYFETEDIQQNINISYRIERENTVWMSAKFAGVFEVAKVMMTPKDIQFYERIDNNYFVGDFKLVSNFLGFDLSYPEIEHLLLAENIKPFEIALTDFETTENTILMTTNYENNLVQSVIIDKSSLNILSQTLQLDDQILQIKYDTYQVIDNKYFPERLSIYANKKEEEVNLILDYKSMKLNDKLRFPFKIPSNFSPIKL